jgi:hypothetical protein
MNTNTDLANPPSSSAPPGIIHPGLADAMANLEMEDYDEYDPEYGDQGYDVYSDTLAPEDSASNIGGPRRAQDVGDQGAEDEEPVDDGWGGAQVFTYDTPKPINAKRPGQPTDCPEHGLVCPRGICKFQAAKKAKEEREKERLAKKKAREEAIERSNKRKFGPKGKGAFDSSLHLPFTIDKFAQNASFRRTGTLQSLQTHHRWLLETRYLCKAVVLVPHRNSMTK